MNSNKKKPSGAQPDKQAARDRQARFRALITGEFRAEFARELAIALRRARRADRERAEREQDLALRDGAARLRQAIWQAQEAEARVDYPALDLQEELENPAFLRLLTDKNRPLSVRQAYEAVHLTELRAEIERQAAQRVLEAVQARARRPREGGVAPQADLPTYSAAATRAGREQIARRALRGEQISL